MNHAVLVDTTPLYAITDDSDAHHKRALSELARLVRSKCEVLVSYPILLEAHTLILFKLGRKAADEWLIQISAAAFVNPIPDDYRRAIARIRALPDQTITLVDAMVAEIANRLKVQVWTYDHHFDVMRVPVWRA
jgi:uncharacterized protein